MEKILRAADSLSKPVVAVFLGSDKSLYRGHKVHGTFSLESAALRSLEQVGIKPPGFGFSDEELTAITEKAIARLEPEQKYFRGLYCGGTFTEEALIYFNQYNPETNIYCNLKNRFTLKLDSHLKSYGHTVLDLGAEDFTKDAPHPVFDPAIRVKRLTQEVTDPEVAVILMDFITGPGVHPDPVSAVAGICEKRDSGHSIIFIANICGSAGDPQNTSQIKRLLEDSGVIVTASNYQSTRLVSRLISALEKRR
jgi:hypothetical protein